MKDWILIFSILSIFSTFTFGQSQTQTKEKTQTAPKGKTATDKKQKGQPSTDEFTTLIAKYYEAWNTLNLANPAKYYAQDPDLVFYDIAPLKYKGWKEYQAGVSKLFQDFSSFKLIPSNDLAVTRKGKVAWTTLTFHISGKQKDGTAMELDGRHTAIWEKTKGDWLIVHEHVSAPLPPN